MFNYIQNSKRKSTSTRSIKKQHAMRIRASELLDSLTQINCSCNSVEDVKKDHQPRRKLHETKYQTVSIFL